MPKSLKFEGVTRGKNCYVIKHDEGDEIVFARDDADFLDWCKAQAQESTQQALRTFAAWVASGPNADFDSFSAHKGKTITIDHRGGDVKSNKAQFRVT